MKSVLRWGSEHSQDKAVLGQCSQRPAFPSIRPPWAGLIAPTAVVPRPPPLEKIPRPSSPESCCYSLLPQQPRKMYCPFWLRLSLCSAAATCSMGNVLPTLPAPSCEESTPPARLDVTFSLPDTLQCLALARSGEGRGVCCPSLPREVCTAGVHTA